MVLLREDIGLLIAEAQIAALGANEPTLGAALAVSLEQTKSTAIDSGLPSPQFTFPHKNGRLPVFGAFCAVDRRNLT